MKRLLTVACFFLIVLTGFNLNVHGNNTIEVSSLCAVLMESHSGRVLYEKNAHEQRPVASITKIMTAVIAIENAYLNDYIVISEKATQAVGSSLHLKKGDALTLKDLIYGLMLRSGNDAAIAIAEGVAGSVAEFVVLMNEKAKALGLKNTVFENPSGLDEESKNLSTAYDFALITRYAMNNPLYREINNTSIYRAKSLNGEYYLWQNKHRLINNYDYIIGGKTGYTKRAKRTLVTVGKRDDLELIVVTLNGANDWQDHLDLIRYGFREYEPVTLMRKGLFEVKELNQLFYLDDKIVYPIKASELNQFRFFIETDLETKRYYLYLIKGQEIHLKKEVYLYEGEAVFSKNDLTVSTLWRIILKVVRDVLW